MELAMRALVLPSLWAVALTMAVMVGVFALGRSTDLHLSGGLGAIIDGPAIHDLETAAGQGDMASVESVLSRRPDLVNRSGSYGWTPLHEAARGGYTRLVRVLLRHGADANARNRDGNTPLHEAVRAGEPGTTSALLAGKAYVNVVDRTGQTPLDVAAHYGWASIARMLRRHGAVTGADVPAIARLPKAPVRRCEGQDGG